MTIFNITIVRVGLIAIFFDNTRAMHKTTTTWTTTTSTDCMKTTMDLTRVIPHSTWIIPYKGNTVFDTIPNELMAILFGYLNPHELYCFSLVCKDTFSLAAYTLDMVLCHVGFTGTLPLPLVIESKPLIDRIRKYYPEFDPPPCDYTPNDEEYFEDEYDDYTPPDDDSDDDDWYDPYDPEDYFCGAYDYDYYDEGLGIGYEYGLEEP